MNSNELLVSDHKRAEGGGEIRKEFFLEESRILGMFRKELGVN